MALLLLLLPLVYQHRLRLRHSWTTAMASNFPSFEYMHYRYRPISSTNLVIPFLPIPTPTLNSSHHWSILILHSSRQRSSETYLKRLLLRTKRQEEGVEEQSQLLLPAGTSLSNCTITASRRSQLTLNPHPIQTRDHHPHMALFLAQTQGRYPDHRALPLTPDRIAARVYQNHKTGVPIYRRLRLCLYSPRNQRRNCEIRMRL